MCGREEDDPECVCGLRDETAERGGLGGECGRAASEEGEVVCSPNEAGSI